MLRAKGSIISAALCFMMFAGAPVLGQSPASNSRLTIGDKTLVAWVSLANLSQQGGAVISLMDDQEHFDAIVIGEREPKKWMAGSDFFHRTPQDQADYAPETTDDKTAVQIAITYHKNVITLYRNARQYACYQIDKPQSFDEYVTVLLGLRYLGGGGEIGFLAGAIEEARLYDTALDTQTIARLKPNVAADPRPLARWTFEDGTAADAMENFPQGELQGKAFIADGKLHLDGSSSYVEIARRRPPVVQSMFYKARSRQTGNMWDTWLYLHEGTYYLYYLANRGPSWNNISMATSPDGVHWTEHGRVLAQREGATWMGTGSTWKSPNFENDGKFFMNFSEWRGPRQTIFFAESKDLLHWRRLEDRYEFKQDTRWYELDGRWDCIWTMPRLGGGLFGYWTATPKPETGGRFGFGQTLDGVTWEALAPPKVHDIGGGEVGAIEQIGDRYYMMFGTGVDGWHGMVTLVAQQPSGPFEAASKNSRLLQSGHTYFARFLRTPEGLLVNHHAIARNGQVYMGLLKAAVVDQEGTLRLGYWPGNEKLKRAADLISLSPTTSQEGSSVNMLPQQLDTTTGVVLQGQLSLPKAGSSDGVGLYIGCGEEGGSAILVYAGGRAELGLVKADGTGFQAERQVDRQIDFGPTAHWRLLLKGSLLEFYINDILIDCHSLPTDATGRIGVIGEVNNLKAWRIAPDTLVNQHPKPTPEQEVVWADGFDSKLADNWSWLREKSESWRLKNHALDIRVEPGLADTVKNALVAQAPDRSQGKFAVQVTVTSLSQPTQQYEQAGITWYNNGKPVFKLVKELVNGELYIIPGPLPMTSQTVQLRLVVTVDTWLAQFRTDAQGPWQKAATGQLPPPNDDQVSIQCYNGPAEDEHWIRFDDFMVVKLAD